MVCPCCCGPCAKTSATQMIVDVSLSPFSGGCDDRGNSGFDACAKINGSYVFDLSENGGCTNGNSFRVANSDVSLFVDLSISFVPSAGLASVSLSSGFSRNVVSATSILTNRNFVKSYHPVPVQKSSQERQYDLLLGDSPSKQCLVYRQQDFDGSETPNGCYSDPMNWKFTSSVTWTQGFGLSDIDGQVQDASRAGGVCGGSMCPNPGVGNPANLLIGLGYWHPCTFLPGCYARCDVRNATINIRFQ
jgi:hypothetical protein